MLISISDIESYTGFRVVLPMHRGKSLLPIEEVKDEITGESAVFLDVGFCSGFCPTTHRSPYDHVVHESKIQKRQTIVGCSSSSTEDLVLLSPRGTLVRIDSLITKTCSCKRFHSCEYFY
ncbi:Oidioi.mRNA.OKI2018_I69.chr2.g6715.t1.cds [Oikopleura dioica]|uniref:Oidioi.mRNA.OKI2018_I69.chr2.g6715.t1.cds n=1 Tax=Oikopleura dioica TaxID=34765 RepID=A0ABN7TAQ7_OIKDI|nr:Oidioi.mRNA.OKI2018_I69.chr2.g6715.t1.cds [Oikopleura dioica]